jgi:hypothetical protein
MSERLGRSGMRVTKSIDAVEDADREIIRPLIPPRLEPGRLQDGFNCCLREHCIRTTLPAQILTTAQIATIDVRL